MAKIVEYQGYTVQSTPHHLADDAKWGLRIVISVDDHHDVRTREFSADGVYATEPEADIHGITYGQRVIDGKVDGRSVGDMKTTDRRATPRLQVQFRTTFLGSSTLEGTGIIPGSVHGRMPD